MMPGEVPQDQRSMREELFKLQAYWARKCRPDGRLPGRADIDPIEMRFALGHLLLVDVERGAPPRFRHRLVGTHIVERAGYDATGRYVDEIPDAELAARICESYERALATKAPVRQVIDDIVDGRSTKLELVRLPLASDGENVDMILSAAYFERAA
jgi:hypothetical protein